MRYHISRNGKTLPCRAKGACPLGTAVSGEGARESLLEYSKNRDTQKEKLARYEAEGIKFSNDEAAERGIYVNETVSILIDNGMITSKIYTDENGVYTKERQAMHRKLLDKLHDKYKDVPSDGKALFSAGLPGAGKTTVLNMLKEQDPNLDKANYAIVSSDDFKELFAEHGMIPEVEGLHPMEASTLTHEESSYLADEFLRELAEKKKNVIYDFTCKDFKTTAKRMGILTNAGYQEKDMQFVFVDIPLEVAGDRAIGRYSNGLNIAIAPKKPGDEIGGRYLPPDVLYKNKSLTGKYSSKNAEALIKVYGHFSEKGMPKPLVFDNSGDSRIDSSYKPTKIDFDTFSNR